MGGTCLTSSFYSSLGSSSAELVKVAWIDGSELVTTGTVATTAADMVDEDWFKRGYYLSMDGTEEVMEVIAGIACFGTAGFLGARGFFPYYVDRSLAGSCTFPF